MIIWLNSHLTLKKAVPDENIDDLGGWMGWVAMLPTSYGGSNTHMQALIAKIEFSVHFKHRNMCILFSLDDVAT